MNEPFGYLGEECFRQRDQQGRRSRAGVSGVLEEQQGGWGGGSREKKEEGVEGGIRAVVRDLRVSTCVSQCHLKELK